jgi:hypothetical protein
VPRRACLSAMRIVGVGVRGRKFEGRSCNK